jgi:hypothetical protein
MKGMFGQECDLECDKSRLKTRPFLYSSSMLFEEKDGGLEGWETVGDRGVTKSAERWDESA